MKLQAASIHGHNAFVTAHADFEIEGGKSPVRLHGGELNFVVKVPFPEILTLSVPAAWQPVVDVYFESPLQQPVAPSLERIVVFLGQVGIRSNPSPPSQRSLEPESNLF